MPEKSRLLETALLKARAALVRQGDVGAVAEIDQSLAAVRAITNEPDVEALRRELERSQLAGGDRGFFNAMLEQSPVATIISDADGKLIFQNQASERMWAGSASADSMKGWGQYRIFFLDGREYTATERPMYRALQLRTVVSNEEANFERFDGTMGVLLTSAAPVLAADGTLQGGISVSTDVTAARQAERELQLSQARFATTLSSIGDAVISTTRAQRIDFMNPIAEALTGWTADEARGRPMREVFQIINELTGQDVENPVEKVLATGKIVELANHTLLIRKDGTRVPIDDSAAPIRAANGEIAGVVLVFRDVTRRRHERDRREFLVKANAMLAANVDYAHTLTAIVNLAVPKLADWCSVEIGDDPRTSQQLAVGHVDPAKVEFARTLRAKFPPEPDATMGLPKVLRTGESELVSSVPPGLFESMLTGERLQLARELKLNSWMVVPMKAHNAVLGAITFVSSSERRYDAADLSFAEELASCAALAVTNAKLFDAERTARVAAVDARDAEQRLIGIVSHDLRNPLAAITATAYTMLKRTPIDEKSARGLDRIIRSSERAIRLIRDLLDLTQLRMGGSLQLQRAPGDLHQILRQAIEEIHAAHATKPKIEAQLEGSGEGYWDSDRLAQALGNLLANAIVHGDGSPVKVVVTGTEKEVVIALNNRGAPIPPEKLPSLFAPFGRGTQQASAERVGLGLFIVKQIVNAHQGQLTVESNDTNGTTFTVRLPRD